MNHQGVKNTTSTRFSLNPWRPLGLRGSPSTEPELRDSPYSIVVDNLTKRFGTFTAVDRISFSVSPGEVYGWLGPNGAGKTTTIRILLGLLKPTEGKSYVLGYNSATQTKAMHAEIGYMSQLFTLYNDLTARENIHFYGQTYGLSRSELRQREAEILDMAGLHGREAILTGELSGGWKQRLALGCAIVHRPKVLFLDEPTAGVDPISRREFWGLIYSMAKKGLTVLVTTHYMDEAELCQRVGFISQGRLVALDTPDQLKKSKMHGQVLEIATSDPDRAMQVLKAAQKSGRFPLDEVALYGAQLHVVVPSVESYREPLREYLQGENVAVEKMDWIAPSLEDVFISAIKPKAEPSDLSE